MASMPGQPGWRIMGGCRRNRRTPLSGHCRGSVLSGRLPRHRHRLFGTARRPGGALGAGRRFSFVHGKRTEFARPHELAQLRSLGVLSIGTLQALRLLHRWRPHLVIGAGGYVMAPALLAAALLRLPRVIMEQNLVPGLTVRVLARYAQRVFTSFPESSDFLPEPQVIYTGTPIRPEIIAQASDTSPDATTCLNILVVGGSQGAHRLNQAVIEALPILEAHSQQVSIVHQTGETDLRRVTEAYEGSSITAEVRAFLHDMPKRYHWAHLVLCRAGASTLAELTACGKPAILVPYPHAADDHQRHNAWHYENTARRTSFSTQR